MPADKKDEKVIEDIKFTEVKREKFDPINSEPITENLRKDQFAPPPKLDANKPFEPIPEPQTQFRPNPNGQYFGGGTPPKNGGAPQQPFNEPMNDMPEDEKDEAAEQAAEMVLALYGSLKAASPKLITISERKLKKMEEDGLINLTLPLQKSPTDTTRVTIIDIVKNFNASVSEGYVVTNEFKESVRPVLVRVLKKKGVKISDEQYLLFAFGQDLVQTGFHLIAGMRQRNEVLTQLKDIHTAYKAAQGFTTSTPPPPPNEPTQQARPSAREPEESVVDSVKFDKADVKTSTTESGVKPDLIINPTDGRRANRRRRERKTN